MAYNAQPTPKAELVHAMATDLWNRIRKHYKIRDWVDVTVAVMHPESMKRAQCCGHVSATTMVRQDKTISALIRLNTTRIENLTDEVIREDLPHAFAHILFRLKPDLGPSFDHAHAYPAVYQTLQEMVCPTPAAVTSTSSV